MSQRLIQYKNICVDLDGSPILCNFNLTVNKGNKVLLTGPSGSGKSTLLKLLLGFIRPDYGEVLYDGNRVNPSTVWDIRKEIAYVSQDTDIGEGIVKDLINAIFAYDHNKGRKYHKRRNLLFEHFGMDKSLMYKEFENLSGGEKQRVCIIISILLGKEIFLLDEVTSALDPALKQKVMDFFLEKKDWTLLIVSHDKTWKYSDIKTVYIDGGMSNS